MDLIEVDVVRIQPLETFFDRGHDVSAREADGIGARAHPSPDLGRDHHVLARDAELLEAAAEEPLGLALGVDIGGIEEIDAAVDRRAQQPGHLALVELPDERPETALPAKGHGADADLRDQQAGAPEHSIFHGCAILMSVAERLKVK